MTETTSLLTWNASEELWDSADAAEGELRVADSWLLSDGRVRGWPLHMDRFAGSCIEAGVGPATLEAPIRELPRAMPERGAWFPRLEMRADGRFHLRLRPCPPRWETASAWPTRDDPRTAPTVKGPDIDRLMQLRAEARRRGADEAVILNDSDQPIEGAGCSIVWWEGDALSQVPGAERILNGVTRRLLGEVAQGLEVEVGESLLSIADVGTREVWLVNALIGIVPVTSWIGHSDRSPVDLDRLATWRQRLADLAVPVG